MGEMGESSTDVINIKIKTMEPATYDIKVPEHVGIRPSPLLLPAC